MIAVMWRVHPLLQMALAPIGHIVGPLHGGRRLALAQRNSRLFGQPPPSDPSGGHCLFVTFKVGCFITHTFHHPYILEIPMELRFNCQSSRSWFHDVSVYSFYLYSPAILLPRGLEAVALRRLSPRVSILSPRFARPPPDRR
jgi:hypothetical protein